MYTISTTPGDRVDTAATIPDALAALAAQLTTQLPHGPVAWKITDPTGTEHRGNGTLNGRLDQLEIAVDELVEELYGQLHRSADGGPHAARGRKNESRRSEITANAALYPPTALPIPRQCTKSWATADTRVGGGSRLTYRPSNG